MHARSALASTLFLWQALNASAADPSCRQAFAEGSAYLSSNGTLVGNFPEELRKNRPAVAAFAARLEQSAKRALDCLVKDQSQATKDAYMSVTEFRDFVASWLDSKPPVPRNLEPDYQARLLKSHAKTVDALARAGRAP